MAEDSESQPTLELRARREAGPFLVEVGSCEGDGQLYELGKGQAVTLGTGSAAGVRLQDRTVSNLHCELAADEQGVVVRDLGSKNGVFVGGARVPHARLEAGMASFVIGRSTVTVRLARSAAPSAAQALPGIVGCSEPMRRIAEEVRRHAGTR